MPRNCNAKIVFDWLKETSQIQNRKYYTAVQLYQMFKQESNDIFALAGITITQRGFARNLNTSTKNNKNFLRIEEKNRNQIKYIRLSDKELQNFDHHTIRISNRKTIIPRNLTQKLSSNTSQSINSSELVSTHVITLKKRGTNID